MGYAASVCSPVVSGPVMFRQPVSVVLSLETLPQQLTSGGSITKAAILATGAGGLIIEDTALAMVSGATISPAGFGCPGPVIGPPIAAALVA